MPGFAERAEKFLDCTDRFKKAVFNHAIVGMIFSVAVTRHPRIALSELRRFGIGGVYRAVFDSNRNLLF